jgi:hypothetical protein
VAFCRERINQLYDEALIKANTTIIMCPICIDRALQEMNLHSRFWNSEKLNGEKSFFNTKEANFQYFAQPIFHKKLRFVLPTI